MPVFIFILFCFFSDELLAQNKEYILSDENVEVFDPEVWENMSYYEDTTSDLSFRQLKNVVFRPYSEYRASNFSPESRYWFKINLHNKSNTHNQYFLEVLDPNLEELDVVYLCTDSLRFKRTGLTREFNTRVVDHKNYLFPLKLEPGEKAVLLVGYKNIYKSRMRLNFRTPAAFINYALDEYYYLGIFYGILLIMALYNLFIYLTTRESLYIFYVVYVLSYCLNSFRIDGMGFQYVWSDFPALSIYIESFSSLILMVSFVAYSQRFLGLTTYAPEFKKYINYSLVIFIGSFVVNYLFFSQINWYYNLMLVPFAVIYLAAIKAYLAGNQAVKFFLIAFSFLVITMFIFILRSFHLIPTNFLTIYALNFGFLVEVVLFSYGMGQRLKMEKEKKEKMDEELILQLQENERLKDTLNRELEQKVEDRTVELMRKSAELEAAFNELKSKNQEIEELNKLLEMDNKLLNQNIKEINKARFLLKDLTLEEFQKIYPDEETCLKYLAEVKWGKSYKCRKCGNGTSYQGKTAFAKRCSKCGYDESPTTFTFFHNSKMPITTSFYLVYLVLSDKEVSSHQLSERLGLRQKTCWAYKKKILEAMEKKHKTKLDSKHWGKIFFDQL